MKARRSIKSTQTSTEVRRAVVEARQRRRAMPPARQRLNGEARTGYALLARGKRCRYAVLSRGKETQENREAVRRRCTAPYAMLGI